MKGDRLEHSISVLMKYVTSFAGCHVKPTCYNIKLMSTLNEISHCYW